MSFCSHDALNKLLKNFINFHSFCNVQFFTILTYSVSPPQNSIFKLFDSSLSYVTITCKHRLTLSSILNYFRTTSVSGNYRLHTQASTAKSLDFFNPSISSFFLQCYKQCVLQCSIYWDTE